jgi:hypothetical protein
MLEAKITQPRMFVRTRPSGQWYLPSEAKMGRSLMDANRDAIDVVPAAEKGSEERDLLRSAELDFVS